ncbi:MAG: hypothetical protein Q4Q00_12060, partial [Turicibacter sp.]|nr:hypothetical protein [Turicibacter sp.]
KTETKSRKLLNLTHKWILWELFMSFYLDTHLSDRAYMIGEIGIDEVNEIKALKRLSTSYFITIKKSHKMICVIFIVE